MNEHDLCQKRLLDLSNQANRKGIVTFSDFLNLNEQNIYHTTIRLFSTKTQIFGGYDTSERQMVAFIPDALYYEWNYPIVCIQIIPRYPKYAEELNHRDILGACMNLGIERSKLGDIVRNEHGYFLFCEDTIAPFIIETLSKIRHTFVYLERVEDLLQITVAPQFEERFDMIASNRIDCIIAKAYHFSRQEAAEYLYSEKVFVNGQTISNCNYSCKNDTIISVRGKGRFIFSTDNSYSKKGKLRVKFQFYK